MSPSLPGPSLPGPSLPGPSLPGPRAGLQLLAIVGATATGKSALAVGLARRLGGEIVNADSMALYRGMDAGTAKPTPAERGGVPHHLLDVLDPEEPASVVAFQRQALDVITACRGRGSLPIMVGGSALYVRSVLDGFDFPGTDPAVRARLEAQLLEQGTLAMHARLAELDPVAAGALLATNARRVVRALEVVELTGRPYSASLPARHYVIPGTLQIGLELARDVLDQRIEARVHAMWAAGLVDEVKRLEAALRLGRTACKALGYAQVLSLLAGEIAEDEARQETIRATRRFARRQDQWFRKDPRVHWLPADDADLLERATALVLGS